MITFDIPKQTFHIIIIEIILKQILTFSIIN